MATIQIADKPTLDAVKALLESSGGVKGYPNVSVVTIAQNSTVKITGKGKVTVPNSSVIRIVSIDGVGYDTYFSGSAPLVISFEKSIEIRYTSSNENFNKILVQLAN